MACAGFTCSKNALAALNILYIMVAFVLIGVAAYGKAVAVIINIAIMSGIIACGVFLLIIAIIGLIGAVKHHQVLLFFYMIILFLLFLIQFAVACACLASNSTQQEGLVRRGWEQANDKTKQTVYGLFQCCGFKQVNSPGDPTCHDLDCCKSSDAPCCAKTQTVPGNTTHSCPCSLTCWTAISAHMNEAVKIAGGIGLFFSFTEMIGVWLALRYRNQKDPRANPSAFL